MPYRAVRYYWVLCRAVPCCVPYLLFRTCQVSFDEVSTASTEVHHTKFVRSWHYLLFSVEVHGSFHGSSHELPQKEATRAPDPVCTYCIVEEHQTLPAQLSSAIAQQREAQRRVVLRRAALCFLANTPQYQVSCEIPGTRYRCTCVYSSFCILY